MTKQREVILRIIQSYGQHLTAVAEGKVRY